MEGGESMAVYNTIPIDNTVFTSKEAVYKAGLQYGKLKMLVNGFSNTYRTFGSPMSTDSGIIVSITSNMLKHFIPDVNTGDANSFSYAFICFSNPGAFLSHCYYQSGYFSRYDGDVRVTNIISLPIGDYNGTFIGVFTSAGYTLTQIEITAPFANLDVLSTVEQISNAVVSAGIQPIPSYEYPITYHYTNSIVTGPSVATVGDTVTVSAVPDNNYGITDAASQILVTNNDVAVEYQWNPSTNTITFTMPNPS